MELLGVIQPILIDRKINPKSTIQIPIRQVRAFTTLSPLSASSGVFRRWYRPMPKLIIMAIMRTMMMILVMWHLFSRRC